ncbi:MAG: DUF3276 family protein [Flavobacteriia bacterium]|nr:DUF3276 family protein [Flavobacteriia bacterium]
MGRENNDDFFSKVVRAGKRTYFFDIKSTKGNDLYITMTESKKTSEFGKENFEKHKIFLYKEDFEKFQEGLEEVIKKIKEIKSTLNSNNDVFFFESSSEQIEI